MKDPMPGILKQKYKYYKLDSMEELEKKKIKLQIMKMETNIVEYEVKIAEREEEIKRIESQIELCKKTKEELQEQLSK